MSRRNSCMQDMLCQFEGYVKRYLLVIASAICVLVVIFGWILKLLLDRESACKLKCRPKRSCQSVGAFPCTKALKGIKSRQKIKKNEKQCKAKKFFEKKPPWTADCKQHCSKTYIPSCCCSHSKVSLRGHSPSPPWVPDTIICPKCPFPPRSSCNNEQEIQCPLCTRPKCRNCKLDK